MHTIHTRREYEDVFTQYFLYNSIFILGRIYKWLFRAKIGAWFRMCGNTMGISTDVNSLSVKTNRERAMSIASTREMRNLIPGTCVPKHAKIFYILPKRDTQLTLEEDLKVFVHGIHTESPHIVRSLSIWNYNSFPKSFDF